MEKDNQPEKNGETNQDATSPGSSRFSKFAIVAHGRLTLPEEKKAQIPSLLRPETRVEAIIGRMKEAGDIDFGVVAAGAFQKMVEDPGFSCLGAKAALNEGAYQIRTYSALGAEESTPNLARDLREFAGSASLQSDFSTFIAVFRGPTNLTEEAFEAALWRQLRLLHEDDRKQFEWDPAVSSDPDDPKFSFSFGGRSFYVLGMHAESSRMARRFPWPALVFNPHSQFEKLRSEGKWKRMQKSIRAREIALQGATNPMVVDFGEKSEARQYSGRAVPDDWKAPFQGEEGKCPFHH